MKLALSICFLILSCLFGVNAQILINGDFSINSGNSPISCANYPPSIYSPGILDGTVLNWNVTHGSPNFPFSYGSLYPNSISMVGYSSGTMGEGIVGNYSFVPNKSYVVSLNVISIVNPSAFKIAFGSGPKPRNANCSEIACIPGSANGAFPVNHNQSHVITYTIPALTTGHNLFTLNSTFPSGPPIPNNEWVWLYVDGSSQTSCESEITIDYIYMRMECESSLTLSNAIIPQGHYVGYRSIMAGSSYGSGTIPSTVLGPCIFEANGSVRLAPGFIADATNGPFIAETNIQRCGPGTKPSKFDNFIEEGQLEIQYGSSIGNVSDYINETEQNNIKISPNPAYNHEFTVINSYNEKINYKMYDVNGKCIDNGLIEANSKHGFNYHHVPDGLYYIRFLGKNINETKKITLK